MNDLEKKGIGCGDCTGKCCTFHANSMQMTPLETEDLYQYLINENLWGEGLEKQFEKTISEYRLDKEISTGKNSTLRRTYTCPFFKFESLGCPLPKDVKPYGCLAFNATIKSVTDGQSCTSDLELLEKRETEDEVILNQKIKEKFNFYWEKLPIPMALLARHRVSK